MFFSLTDESQGKIIPLLLAPGRRAGSGSGASEGEGGKGTWKI
jgi:hypothetical protein